MEVNDDVFVPNLAAYNNGIPVIINQGGTRSAKTYSIMQVLYWIAYFSNSPLVISIVSYALPHLRLGAIRDFERILMSTGIVPDKIRNKTENTYKIGKSIIEFYGVDNLAKVHGPERDITFINECNHKITGDIYTQLAIRTRKTIFLDFNPTREFWLHSDVIKPGGDFKVIKSTYLDNRFLTPQQRAQIESRKSNEQWWRVYGLGELGQLEDSILTNWKYGEFNNAIPYGYGLDFGSRDPDAMTKVAVDNKEMKIYVKQEIYNNNMSTAELGNMIHARGVGAALIVADSAATRTIQDLYLQRLNIVPVSKGRVVDDIKMLRDYEIIVDPESYDLGKELNNWVWVDKRGEIPLDADNHLIDSMRYYWRHVTAPIRVTQIKRPGRVDRF